MEDKKIVALFWNRADSAVSALAEKFGQRVYGLAMNFLKNPEDAEECVNDTYLAIWNGIPPGQPEHLSAYVCRTARNIALNKIRANQKHSRELSLDELAGCIPAPCLEDGRLLGQAMDLWLNTQNAANRTIFLRRYWFGDSVKAIAQDLKMTESAVSVRLSRCRDSLRSFLIKEGYYERGTE